MIARWPGTIPGGRTVDAMSMNFDQFATVLELAGIEPPDDRVIDGRNIMPVLRSNETSPHDTLYFFWRDQLLAIHHENWKYHRHHQVEDVNVYPWPTITKKSPYMYDLRTDRNESYSVLGNHPDVAEKLSGMMDSMDRQIKSNSRGWL